MTTDLPRTSEEGLEEEVSEEERAGQLQGAEQAAPSITRLPAQDRLHSQRGPQEGHWTLGITQSEEGQAPEEQLTQETKELDSYKCAGYVWVWGWLTWNAARRKAVGSGVRVF